MARYRSAQHHSDCQVLTVAEVFKYPILKQMAQAVPASPVEHEGEFFSSH